METTAMETMALENSMENQAGLSLSPILVFILFAVGILLILFLLYRSSCRKMAGRLCELENEYQTLRSYDVYAELFLKNARAFQALLGIEHGCRENAGMMQRLRTEYVSLLCRKDLTPAGYAVSVPTLKQNRSAYISRKISKPPRELKAEISETKACVSEWENRLTFKKAVEGTGALLYRIAEKSEGPDSQADEIRGCIRKVSALLCGAGIYPMFYDDFEEASPNRKDFEVGSPYATEYPGLYEKRGQQYCILQECWGVRKGGSL